MILFSTPTELPILAATTMGISVKDTENAIGKFGTGLKYAIAGILRLGGQIDIFIRDQAYRFTTEPTEVRGRTFHVIACNGVPCGFTTELGKHWRPWQLFRELASNTLDEGGCWRTEHNRHDLPAWTQGTMIVVSCRELEDAARTEDVFIGERETLIESTNGATLHAGATEHYYYNGIRAGSFGMLAPVTVNVRNGTLSEDRLLDLATVQLELAWAFRTATKIDRNVLLQAISADSPEDFWCRHLQHHAIANAKFPAPVLDFLLERPKFVRHQGFRAALDKQNFEDGKARWQAIPITDHYRDLLAAGERVCERLGVDAIPRNKVFFTRDLPDHMLAVTCIDTRDVWFDTKLVLRGRDEFLAGYLEEATHAMTGHPDCTRAMQNTLFAMLVSAANCP